MKKTTLTLTFFFFATIGIYAQNSVYGTNVENALSAPTQQSRILNINKPDEECDDVITCENLENGVFINGMSGQKAAIDIPIDAETTITINQIKVTLSSGPEPAYVHFKFYKSNDSIPSDLYQEINNTTIIAADSIGYEPLHGFVIRNMTLQLEEPIVLNGAETTDRFWMSPISDANAWATTDGVSNGANITGKAVVIGSDSFDWFELGDIEGLYEIDAECETLGIDDDMVMNASVYPNPAHERLNIKLSNNERIQQVQIFNITGQKIKSFDGAGEDLDISSLQDGLYFAQIHSTENQILVVKFVVGK